MYKIKNLNKYKELIFLINLLNLYKNGIQLIKEKKFKHKENFLILILNLTLLFLELLIVMNLEIIV